MRDLLADFRTARGLELSSQLPSLDEKSVWQHLDDFVIEGTIVTVHASRYWSSHDEVARLEHSRSHFGLSQYPEFWCIWNWVAAEALPSWEDAPSWLWGPPARHGRLLFETAARMGSGEILRLLRLRWPDEALAGVFSQWLTAAHVHKSARGPALDLFLHPTAPITRGKTIVRPASPPMQQLAEWLCREHGLDGAAYVADAATLLAWIAAKAAGAERVRIPSKAVTQGRRHHPDSPGIVAHRGKKLWNVVKHEILEQTRGHLAGKANAEYRIKSQYRDILRVTLG